MTYEDKNITMEGVRILPGQFRNFTGRVGKYNLTGERHFAVQIDDVTAEQMARDKWNVKTLKALEEGEPDTYFIEVAVSYKGRPPRIVVMSSKGRQNLTEKEVEILDWANYDVADMIIRPYNWHVQDNSGIKGYLQALYVTITEDALELKYAEIIENENQAPPTPQFQ